MEKTAKEMFEELGYEFIDPADGYTIYSKENDGVVTTFEFDTELADVFRATETDKQNVNVEKPHWLSLEEVKAITQQMKELGWIE